MYKVTATQYLPPPLPTRLCATYGDVCSHGLGLLLLGMGAEVHIPRNSGDASDMTN